MAVLSSLVLEATGVAIRAVTDTPTPTVNPSSPQTSSQTSGQNDTGSSKERGSSPLLFFVALGFGVVFTNLWIIVGVKYCFRYNARNRARLGDDGEPLPLENMPRPHRRRREKKLMTMEQVNDKFPMMKYKTWVIERAREGLPTAGGVDSSASKHATNVMAISVIPHAKERRSIGDANAAPPTLESAAIQEKSHEDSNDKLNEKSKDTEMNKNSKDTDVIESVGQTSTAESSKPIDVECIESHQSDEEDDEHITAALPPECLTAPGDSCAICIDTLEDDDDIRGLLCGHAFHAVCLDPWLTSRRACCPLCKADYYTPKPRPNQDADAAAQTNTTLDPRNNTRLNMPTSFAAAWFRSGQGRPATSRRNSRRTAAEGTQTASTPQTTETSPGNGMLSSIRSALRFGRRNDGSPSATAAGITEVTPTQLESATR